VVKYSIPIFCRYTNAKKKRSDLELKKVQKGIEMQELDKLKKE
jgi:hypothetical protein